MNNQSIIKWSFLWAYIWVGGILYLIVYIGEHQIFGTWYSAWVFGLFHVLLGIYYFMKTRLYQFFIVGIVLGTGYWHYEAAEHMDTIFSMTTVYIHLLTLFVVFVAYMPFLNKAIRLELHARRLFRLAALSVHDAQNGYTARPYSAGKVDYTMDDIIGLARFMSAKDIIRYRREGNAVAFSFSMNVSPLYDTEFNLSSTMRFDQDGNMSVRISRKDYNQYRKQLSFDQLCGSFADLFRRFIRAYQQNNENRIIEELKSA